MNTGIVQNIDDKIEEDFLFFLEHFKGAFDGLKSNCEKEICEVVITHEIYVLLE